MIKKHSKDTMLIYDVFTKDENFDKETFIRYNVKLSFIKGSISLSIIDECLTNTKEEVKNKLNKFSLI